MGFWQGLLVSTVCFILFTMCLYETFKSWCAVRRVSDQFKSADGNVHVQIAWENNRLNWALFSINIAILFTWIIFLTYWIIKM